MNARRWIAALLSTLTLALLVGVLALLIVADAKAGDTEIKPIATTAETNLRKAPGTDGQILALIPKGTTVKVGGCRNGWCRISWKGLDGYAIARNLGTAAAPRTPVAAWHDHGPWQKIGKVDLAGAATRMSAIGPPPARALRRPRVPLIYGMIPKKLFKRNPAYWAAQ
jgi:Bacterial SH3 domain